MKEEVRFKWRIKWSGRWTTTRHHCTEEVIKREHPEAVAVPGTMQVTTVAESPEEFDVLMYGPVEWRKSKGKQDGQLQDFTSQARQSTSIGGGGRSIADALTVRS